MDLGPSLSKILPRTISISWMSFTIKWFTIHRIIQILIGALTGWKVSKHGVCSGPYFLVFGMNTGKYGPEKMPYLDSFHVVSNLSVKAFHDSIIFEVDGIVSNKKNAYLENPWLFQWFFFKNPKTFKLFFKYHVFRSYHILAEITFNCLSNLSCYLVFTIFNWLISILFSKLYIVNLLNHQTNIPSMHFNFNLKAYHINLKGLKIEKEQSYAHKANCLSVCLVFDKNSFQYNVLNFRAQINFASISNIDKNTLIYTFWFVSWYYVGPFNLKQKKQKTKKTFINWVAGFQGCGSNYHINLLK